MGKELQLTVDPSSREREPVGLVMPTAGTWQLTLPDGSFLQEPQVRGLLSLLGRDKGGLRRVIV